MFERKWNNLFVAAALALGFTSLALAQDDAQPKPNPDKQERAEKGQGDKAQDKAQMDQWPASYHKASQLIGLRVDDKDGKKIGDIRNLAINAENGHIRYAVMETPNGLTVVPMPAIKVNNKRDRASVNTTAERMKNAPPFSPQGWNTIGDAKWGQDVFSFYGIAKDPDFNRERQDFVPAGAVIGNKIEARKADNLGSIKDIVVDAERSLVSYIVLQFGNENKLFAAPWPALIVTDVGKKVVLRGVEREDLTKGAGFPNNRWPTEKDFSWNKDTNFDSRPPTWLYGLKGGGNGGGGGDDGGVMGGWQTNSKYGQLFDRKTIERIRGTIVRSENIAPMPAMDPGTALTVKTEDGKNIVVHLGPEWFVKHQQGEFKQGAEVDVSGSRVAIDGKPVIMATQLRINGRTMTLREDTGVPAWDTWQERNKKD